MSVKTEDIVCAVICMDQRLLIAKRGSGVHESIWEFLGGKIESGETREQAVAREIREGLELCVDINRYLTTIRGNGEDCALLAHAYLCRYVSGGIHLHAHREYALVAPRELYSHQFGAADQPIPDMFRENAL